MSDYSNEKSSIPNANEVAEGISGTTNSIKEGVSSTMEDFSSKNIMNASNEFLQSNSMIAKFMFIVLVLLVFMVLLNLGLALVYYFTSPNKSPFLISGTLSGTNSRIITQDPASGNSVVYRSNNQSSGIEFTWSMWIKVDSVPPPGNKIYYNIFIKGTNDYNEYGLTTLNSAPGVYLTREKTDPASQSNYCNLYFSMDVVSPIQSNVQAARTLQIPYIPIGKWVHIAYRLQNKVLDCYVNGVISKRLSFDDFIPKQNYDDIIYAGNGGFTGSLSNLRYYDYALSVFEINSVVYFGPNPNSADSNSSSGTDYLSQNWYYPKQT